MFCLNINFRKIGTESLVAKNNGNIEQLVIITKPFSLNCVSPVRNIVS